MQEISENLGKLVKTARIRRNLTQLELAEAIDKSERTVVKIERGKGNPKLDSLTQIVKVLKLDVDALFNSDKKQNCPRLDELCREIADCTEDEAAALVPVVRAFVSALRNAQKIDLQNSIQ